jgi:lipopolysaccharide biosynthesis protein
MKIARHLKRLLHAMRHRAHNLVQHYLLKTLESTPAPWNFKLRNFLFTNLTHLFHETDSYANWKEACEYFITARNPKIKLVDINNSKTPKNFVAKKIAIQAHIYYPELANELAAILNNFPVKFDLLVSTTNSRDVEFIRSQFKSIVNLKKLHILVTPNRGRDLGPLLYGFGKELLNYDYFAHVHTKKSTGTNSIGDEWRKYLLNGLLNTANHRPLKIFELLSNHGMVYCQKHPLIDVKYCRWSGNLEMAQDLCRRLKITNPIPGYIEFPVGSMFWATTEALKPLLEHNFLAEDFDIEQGQTDDTLMHALERSLSHIAISQGHAIAILHDPNQASFYP